MDYDDEAREGERKGRVVDGLLDDLEECQRHIKVIKDQLIALGFDMRLLEPDPMAPDYPALVTLNETDLTNEDGMWYGIHVTVRGTRDTQVALRALVDKYGEERVYGSNSILDQFRWDFSKAVEPTSQVEDCRDSAEVPGAQ